MGHARGHTAGGPHSPEDLLADAPLEAAVAALADRNRQHLAHMTDAERAEALAHWRDLAFAVLSAAGAALGHAGAEAADAPGRAVIVFEDAGPDEIAVHASFFPELEDTGEEVTVTPAQAAALQLLEGMTGEGPEE